ncbi:MFS transporter [Xanthobacter sp. TB0139]|uniref:MFS transporter n=1 Tax=Xanthobacter sp. TB0139 TaxID=3459178 RepID=UPI004039FB00
MNRRVTPEPAEQNTSRTTGAAEERSVQDYIDETPVWRDGTTTPSTPMTRMQWRIWGLAAAGKFFEGLVVFMTGVALPLISREFGMDAIQHGVVGAASLAGILVGALFLGSLSDYFGRKSMFIVEMVLFIIFLVLLSLSPSYFWLVLFLFGVGVALGCDYPTAHLVISESIPSSARGRLVLSAFGFQAAGALMGTIVGYLVLTAVPDETAWRYMYATAIIPALLVVIGRFSITESASWLMAHGREQDAAREVSRLLHRDPPYPKAVKLKARHKPLAKHEKSLAALFNPRNRRATILASVPWFLQDLGTYGIGIFTPTILAASLGHVATHHHDITDLIAKDIMAAKGAALIDLLLIAGIFAAVMLADKVGRIPLQIAGFIGCAAGLLISALSGYFTGSTQISLIFIGFMLFNFMTNMGPNAQTYLLAGEVFPVHIRARGAGFAAGFAKIGAVITAFLFPILLHQIGTQALLFGLIVTSLLGAAITWLCRVETRGRSLDDIDP